MAGAASTVLAYLFPDASPDGFAGLADEAATSRLWAGAAYRSDVEAGLALGRAVGELAVAAAKSDGSDAEWDGSGQPSGDGYYEPTPPDFVDPPFGVLAGTWATWVLPSGDVIRPAPFPEYGSPAWQAELAGVRAATSGRTLAQERIIDYWLSKGPNGFYTEYALALIERERLGEAETAGVLAMLSVAIYDTFVAVWDAKYHYWIARPITVDPELNMYITCTPVSVLSRRVRRRVQRWGDRAGRDLPGRRSRPADLGLGRGRPAVLVRHPLRARRRHGAAHGRPGRALGRRRCPQQWRRG